MKLQGKTAVVTGGSRGIGAAIARRLSADGAWVGIVYRSNAAAAEEIVQSIRQQGRHAEAFRADVTDEHRTTAVLDEFASRFGQIDILVNNAGIFEAAPVGQITREIFSNEMFTHAWSVIATTQAALPHFPSMGGHIVNVSTSLVHQPGNGTAVYSAAKAAVEVLTRGFAMELGPRGIRVNAVAPAITRTDMTSGIAPDQLAKEAELTPLRRLAEPDDIADAVAFLASNDARWITGRTILVDGGRV